MKTLLLILFVLSLLLVGCKGRPICEILPVDGPECPKEAEAQTLEVSVEYQAFPPPSFQ